MHNLGAAEAAYRLRTAAPGPANLFWALMALAFFANEDGSVSAAIVNGLIDGRLTIERGPRGRLVVQTPHGTVGSFSPAG